MEYIEFDPDNDTIEIADEWEIHLTIGNLDISFTFDDIIEIYNECRKELG